MRCQSVGKPLAGKTGTSNDSKDTWFIGFSPDLACGVFVGFDNPRTLGRYEQGATVAAPIFRDFMKGALADQPPTPFRVPPGIDLVSVDRTTGEQASPGRAPGLVHGSLQGRHRAGLQVTDPANASANADAANNNNPATDVDQGTGGLY